MTVTVEPLTINTPRRFYRGGGRILAFRGLPVPDDFDGHRPEDWLASATRLFAEGGDGLTRLADGRALAEALAEDPTGWLGEAHVAAYGTEPMLLTKLLDSGERLPVHAHPDRAFAAGHLGCDHGKTEAWLVLRAEPGARVWLGFRDGLDPETLAELVDAQDDRLLAACNEVEVRAGDTVLVPAGQPHAIGAGILVIELQEPTDFSVMLEHARFGLEEEHAFLGLPRRTALASVDLGPLHPADLTALRARWTGVPGPGPVSVLPAAADDFFTAEVVHPDAGTPVVVDPAYALTVVVQGRGTLTTDPHPSDPSSDPSSLDLSRGDVLLIPHGAGPVRIEGDVTVIRCMPPVPSDDSQPTI